jgi:hypothetical protein
MVEWIVHQGIKMIYGPEKNAELILKHTLNYVIFAT